MGRGFAVEAVGLVHQRQKWNQFRVLGALVAGFVADLWNGVMIRPCAVAVNSFLQPSLNYDILRVVKQNPQSSLVILEGRCAGPEVCPLSRVQAGAEVCIKQLTTAPELTQRLRELGFCEERRIKLVARQSSLICQVCNARLGISQKLADSILVEKVPAR